MVRDRSSAPWPYEDEPRSAGSVPSPTWECPGGECSCHPRGENAERVDHQLHLYDHRIERLGKARCRIIENGEVINVDQPYADDEGVVQVQILATTKQLLVEWAPEDTPISPRYPFRKRCFVDLGTKQDDRVGRRLHNIGYGVRNALSENVEDYERAYAPPRTKITGDPAQVEFQLAFHHDHGGLTAPTREDGEDVSSPRAAALIAQQQAPPPSPPPPPSAPPVPSPKSTVAPPLGKLAITLGAFFSMHLRQLHDKDYQYPTQPAGWKDHPYDVEAMLRHYYYPGNTTARGIDRRHWGQPRPFIQGATVTVKTATRSDTQTTDKDGLCIMSFVQGESEVDLELEVTPPPGQQSPTGKPAGPLLTDKDTKAPFFYRPFTINLRLFHSGAVQVVHITPSKPPWFAKSLGIRNDPKRGPHLTIDWRPDWILPDDKAKAFNPREIGEGKTVEVNAYDVSTPAKKEAAAKEGRPAVVLHQTVSTLLTGNLEDFVRRSIASKVTSIHYLVDVDGHVVKCVDEFWESNHAGNSVWEGRRGVNDYSVGIETIHTDSDPAGGGNNSRQERFTYEQYEALIRLVGELKDTYGVEPRRVLGHNQVLLMAVTDPHPQFPKDKSKAIHIGDALHYDRRECPGSMFEWERLEEKGLALARKPRNKSAEPPHLTKLLDQLEAVPLIKKNASSPEVKALKQMLMDIGYWVSLRPTPRANLSDTYDRAMFQAMLAFQARTFSGTRRAYTIFARNPKPPNPPQGVYGTLDNKTIKAIIETWLAVQP